MTNAERFIDTFNIVDRLLKDLEKDHYESFSSKVKNSKNPLIRNFKDKLLDYSELRNAIVHNPKIGGRFIAEPLKEVVEDFEKIAENLRNPKKVIPTFQFEVLGARKDEKIDKILKIMREKSFSQFPLFDDDNSIIELINTNTISRWLGKNIINDEIIVENPKVTELIPEIEFKNNYEFISRDCNIFTAYSLFIQQIEKSNRNLDVIFITNSGNPHEKLLGLITIEDIANLI